MKFDSVKDSGKRESYATGMVRDTQDGKPRFSLLLRKGTPFEEHMLTRWAQHMANGAKKYGDRNWELASTEEELERFKESALRHMVQWATGDVSEDHAAGIFFNVNAYETTKARKTTSVTVTYLEVCGDLCPFCEQTCRFSKGHGGHHEGNAGDPLVRAVWLNE